MSWEQSLIRIAGYEVETRQKRLAEVVARREAAEMRLLMLDAEIEAEVAFIRTEPLAAFHQSGYMSGCKERRIRILTEIDLITAEESGARDALAEAFESQKKYEHVAAGMARRKAQDAARRETAELDELGVRQASRPRAGGF
ncbi:MAG: flagellar export protein FliJ [Phenylobacterium sp.]|uniref:flagellar export protein FliJ n=1 Tax=Phenylobacterium sp. TaxID=1871053 RepID=UPI0025CF91E9|nr:flagellar export protein FliJ [Phenylobacterium sp.]MCA3727252.1 flagellar export protein FliJ [Phenylobacterium sp.]MCA6242389.1 flagellar export protein FliJ [Phenylobacterium sp.]MCA6246650.1 flagellar export protein FliJ [Phenylobacterium sp.]MCA6253544.1 flagellar export protein FliJ [Phenylobacterium sp.]MCA6260672.1 flagellar export protein FliJ [Phenylobacterium sp.]